MSARAVAASWASELLREWAGSNGVEVPARGRIAEADVDQYDAAGGR